jgi:GT2 family glycosyltransferase/glycosyltransferase involved in cell wall biosynthesis
MSATHSQKQRIAAYTLHPWTHSQAHVRLVAPWQAAGFELVRASQWDQVSLDPIRAADLVLLHRDFPRLAQSYQQVMQLARASGIPVVYDLDDQLLAPPDTNWEGKYYFASDALFPVLQAIVEADAVTVPTPILQAAILPLNANTQVLPTCLDDSVWGIQVPTVQKTPGGLLVILWINDQPEPPQEFLNGIVRFLHRNPETARLIVWGMKPDEQLLSMANVDWKADLPLDYSHYAAHRIRQPGHVCVVPQGDHPYYQSQSPLRYLEHSACGLPGVYSRVPPYSDLIQVGENGLLAGASQEWEDALEELLNSAAVRQRIAKHAQHTLRQSWLLSSNLARWQTFFTSLPAGEQARSIKDPVRGQVVQAAAQARRWQRSLESQIRDREWEVRALNLTLKRKERQASEHIESLGRQLEAIWSSPAWRILHKAQRGIEILASPRRGRTESAAEEPAGVPAEAAPPAASIPAQALNLPSTVPPTASYDLICFSAHDWANLSAAQEQSYTDFAARGCRIFFCSPASLTADSPGLSILGKRVFKVDCPVQVAVDSLVPSMKIEFTADQLDVFERLRWEAGIHDAICWIDDPAWTDAAYLMRNKFGWKIVCSGLAQAGNTPEAAHLVERADVVLPVHPDQASLFEQFQDHTAQVFPPASIIILTYNNQAITRQCLESIFTHTSYPRFEVIVVDNASTDNTVEYLHSIAAAHPNVRLVLNSKNLGFAAGNNQGVSAATGEYIVFLNNDTVVTPGWLSRLISHLKDPQVGAVGPVTNHAGNESQIGVDYSDLSGLDAFASRYTREHAGKTFDIRMLALFCMALRRSVIEAVGPLDERFNIGMYEDDDFSLRLRHKGYRILCAEDVYIHHWGSASFSQLAEERYQRLYRDNRAVFEEKWGTRWEPHRWRMDEE